MDKPNKVSDRAVPFTVPKDAIEGQLASWFRRVVRSNHDLMTALERLRDSYKVLLAERPATEADQAVLVAVEITLNNAKNAQTL